MGKLKAYSVSDANGDSGLAYIIFAESRGKAIYYALHNCDGTFDWYGWTEMRALRRPALDKYYRGKTQMDWDNMNDRIAMVKDAGFRCHYEVDVTLSECEGCPAHQWCDRYKRMNISNIEEKMPHKVSETICVKCGHRQIDVRPVGTMLKDLECPGCGMTGYVIETGEEINNDD